MYSKLRFHVYYDALDYKDKVVTPDWLCELVIWNCFACRCEESGVPSQEVSNRRYLVSKSFSQSVSQSLVRD